MKTKIKKEMLSEYFSPTFNFERTDEKSGSVMVDYCEISIDYEGIEQLKRNIDITNDKEEYIIAYVHFNAGTDVFNELFLSVRSENDECPLSVGNLLDKKEKEIIIDYALELISTARANAYRN